MNSFAFLAFSVPVSLDAIRERCHAFENDADASRIGGVDMAALASYAFEQAGGRAALVLRAVAHDRQAATVLALESSSDDAGSPALAGRVQVALVALAAALTALADGTLVDELGVVYAADELASLAAAGSTLMLTWSFRAEVARRLDGGRPDPPNLPDALADVTCLFPRPLAVASLVSTAASITRRAQSAGLTIAEVRSGESETAASPFIVDRPHLASLEGGAAAALLAFRIPRDDARSRSIALRLATALVATYGGYAVDSDGRASDLACLAHSCAMEPADGAPS